MDMPTERYVLMTVSCPHCQQKANRSRTRARGFGVMSEQVINCLTCKQDFAVMVPDKIVEGPILP